MTDKKLTHIFYLSIICALIIVVAYFAAAGNSQLTGELSDKVFESSAEPLATPVENPGNSEYKTFVFKSFHGADLGGGVFEFEYPANWQNDGQYFSPTKIKFYDIFSVDAPVYFDLISTNIFETSDIKYQIANNKRSSSDSTVKIDGKTFRKYDLADYGSSGGESTGRVIIYFGPKISFGGDDYYLIFHWEENPLTIFIPENDPEVFEEMVSTLKFL